jgi:hypothetical protein
MGDQIEVYSKILDDITSESGSLFFLDAPNGMHWKDFCSQPSSGESSS